MTAIACVISLAGCGGGDSESQGSIPPDTGESILAQLDAVEEQFDAGECDEAEQSATQIQSAIGELGSDVSAELEEALVQASSNLVTLVREDCEPPPEPEPPVEPDIPTGATGETGDDGEGEDDG